ncbi:unnamed protein product [Caenorhabditis brenneri]
MKLLKFPYVVKRHIIKQMNYHEVFWLSIVSHKAVQMIQQIPWRQIKTIQFRVYNTETSIRVIDSEQSRLMNIRYALRNFVGGDSRTLLVLGIKCTIKWNPFCDEFILCTDQSNIFEKLRNHIQSLFFTNHFHLDWRQERAYAEEFCQFLGNLRSSSAELHQKMETQQLEHYSDGSPTQEHVCIQNQLYGSFKESSKFYTIQDLHMKRAEMIAKDVLRCFKGKSAILENCCLYQFQIYEFLEKWKFNAAFKNLEFLLAIPIPGRSFNLDRQWIYSHFQTKKLDPSKKLPVYHYEDKSTNQQYEFSSPYYMVREHDGAVASIGVEDNRFVFAVWNLNEKQMAEKIATL